MERLPPDTFNYKNNEDYETNHSHYWVEDGQLYESYNTLRGLRYRYILDCPEIEDCDYCSKEMIDYIFAEYKEKTL